MTNKEQPGQMELDLGGSARPADAIEAQALIPGMALPEALPPETRRERAGPPVGETIHKAATDLLKPLLTHLLDTDVTALLADYPGLAHKEVDRSSGEYDFMQFVWSGIADKNGYSGEPMTITLEYFNLLNPDGKPIRALGIYAEHFTRSRLGDLVFGYEQDSVGNTLVSVDKARPDQSEVPHQTALRKTLDIIDEIATVLVFDEEELPLYKD